jgi:hypothetical protein
MDVQCIHLLNRTFHYIYRGALDLKVKVVRLSETSVNINQSTRRKVLGNLNLQQKRSEELNLTQFI